VATRARERFVDSRRPVADGRMSDVLAAPGVRAATIVERRETVIADLEDGVALRFEGRTVAFPPVAAGALAAAHAASGPFTAADLPGPLDEAGRVVLVRRLVREGYLRVVAP
jgi:hypothetical protein